MMGLPNCREAALRLSTEYAQAGGRRRGWTLRLHLWMCRSCRRYERYLAWMGRNLSVAVAAGAPRLTSIQRERIREALRGAMR